MDIKRRWMRLAVLLNVLFTYCCFGQSISKVPDSEEKGYNTYRNLQLSEKGQWLTVRKYYKSNLDTILVFNTAKSNRIWTKLNKMNVSQGFLGEKALFAQGNGVAEYIQLKSLKKVAYQNVLKSEVLSLLRRYVILSNDQVLSVFNDDSSKIMEVKDVVDYATDGQSVLTAITKKGKLYEIFTIKDVQPVSVYQSVNELSAIPQFEVGKYSAFTEKDGAKGKIRTVLINTENSSVSIPLKDYYTDADFLKVTPINHTDLVLIESDKKKRPEKSFSEIRYGNDPYLGFRRRGLSESQYWIWNSQTGLTEILPMTLYSDYIPINNERYLLAINKKEQFDYRFSKSLFALFLYDRIMKTSLEIATGIRTVIISDRGRYVVMENELNDEWELYDTDQKTKKMLGKNMTQPVFSDDQRMVAFESTDGIKVYNLTDDNFLPSPLSGRSISIKKKNFSSVFGKYQTDFTISKEKFSECLVVRSLQKENNITSFYHWNGKKMKRITHENPNFTIDFKDGGLFSDTAFSIEEFYNKSPEVFRYNAKTGDKQCLTCSSGVQSDLGFTRQLVSFKNSSGQNLKGLVFFPVDMKPNQKYPMVVRIYMRQGDMSNKYLHHGGDTGFNARKLLEKGYIVYFPDIVMDQKGSGLSALDCVHRSLDALAGNAHIDFDRMGLTGHSFGGYETNFIATHSDRFKAYISSAGVANLVSQYYTYNLDFEINEYSRIENGQYGMKKSYADDPQLYNNNNPILFADQVKAPMFLWSGEKDGNILPSQSLQFFTALMRYRKDVVAIIYADQGHGLSKGSLAHKDALEKSMEWWDYFLKGKKNVDWINKQMINEHN